MVCNVGFAETMNELLNNKYKITKEVIVKFDRYAYKIFTLKKQNNVKVCSIQIRKLGGISSTSKCMTP
jgi:arginine deiminase